jgi:hypothetical protein
MKTITTLGVIATLALISVVPAQGQAGPSTIASRACSGTFGPQGAPGEGFWRRIRTRGVRCKQARKVIRTYLKTGAGVGPSTEPLEILRFTCRIRLETTAGDPGGTGYLRCARGGKTIRAVGHP